MCTKFDFKDAQFSVFIKMLIIKKSKEERLSKRDLFSKLHTFIQWNGIYLLKIIEYLMIWEELLNEKNVRML